MSEPVQFFWTTDGILAALLVRSQASAVGIEFLTPKEQSQQVGLMTRPKGYVVAAHEHLPQHREISDTNEVLVVRRGRIRISLFDSARKLGPIFELEEGDVVLLGAGGHMVEFIEESEVLEIKQGPYSQAIDKVRFEQAAVDES